MERNKIKNTKGVKAKLRYIPTTELTALEFPPAIEGKDQPSCEIAHPG